MTAPTSFPLPQEIRLSPTKDMLTISFDTGDKVSLPAELLRVESPSAEVQG
ncbi:MAG: gamma-butyrobetaine hydroxylase-like domain-containing protein, partial [Candidatus Puniceispirillum sp.]